MLPVSAAGFEGGWLRCGLVVDRPRGTRKQAMFNFTCLSALVVRRWFSVCACGRVCRLTDCEGRRMLLGRGTDAGGEGEGAGKEKEKAPVEMCGALHILVKHQKSRRTSSWKDKEGKVSPRARPPPCPARAPCCRPGQLPNQAPPLWQKRKPAAEAQPGGSNSGAWEAPLGPVPIHASSGSCRRGCWSPAALLPPTFSATVPGRRRLTGNTRLRAGTGSGVRNGSGLTCVAVAGDLQPDARASYGRCADAA